MRESRDPGAAGVDWPGTVTFTGALALLTFGIVQGPQSGWTSPPVLALLAGAGVLFALFVAAELRRPRPMLDLTLFRVPRFVGVQILPVAVGFGFITLIVFLPIWFIGVQERSELEAGLMMLPITAPMLVVPFLAATLARRVPPAVLCAVGLGLVAAGGAWLTTIDPDAGLAALALPMLVIGVGTGLPWGLMDGLAVSVVPTERAGMAAGIFATMRVAGEAIAVAVAGAILVSVTQSRLAGEIGAFDTPLRDGLRELANRVANGDLAGPAGTVAEAARPAFRALLGASYTDALQAVLVVVAAIAAVAAVVIAAALRTPRSGERSAAQPLAELAE
jgi:hypothetical protein